MDRRETERLLTGIRAARAAGEPAAIATVVRVKGSAYRREGARMLIRHNGTYECALSGGCLEPAVAEAAARVIATGEPAVVSYDLADDSVWGLGIGCTGLVDIYIERLEDDPLSSRWLEILERGDAAVRVTPLSVAAGRLIVPASGEVTGELSDPALEQLAVTAARSRLAAACPQSAPECIADAELFHEVATPPPQLVMFGGGHDAAPVARLAWTLGFDVAVVDVRDAFLTAERFGAATRIRADPTRFADSVTLGAGSFALVMNHHLDRDRESLRFCLESDAAYIGILGPRTRYEKLSVALAKNGYVADAAKAARVRSPVGLSLGAETSEEIAVSIVGELLAVRRGFSAGFLNGSSGSLHRPESTRLLAIS
jgi:xanthine dehydrogenase accessory factor